MKRTACSTKDFFYDKQTSENKLFRNLIKQAIVYIPNDSNASLDFLTESILTEEELHNKYILINDINAASYKNVEVFNGCSLIAYVYADSIYGGTSFRIITKCEISENKEIKKIETVIEDDFIWRCDFTVIRRIEPDKISVEPATLRFEYSEFVKAAKFKLLNEKEQKILELPVNPEKLWAEKEKIIQYLYANKIFDKNNWRDDSRNLQIKYPIIPEKDRYGDLKYKYISGHIQKINDDGSFICAATDISDLDKDLKVGSIITVVKVTNGDISHYCLKKHYQEMLLLIGQELVEKNKHAPNDWKRLKKLQNMYGQK